MRNERALLVGLVCSERIGNCESALQPLCLAAGAAADEPFGLNICLFLA